MFEMMLALSVYYIALALVVWIVTLIFQHLLGEMFTHWTFVGWMIFIPFVIAIALVMDYHPI